MGRKNIGGFYWKRNQWLKIKGARREIIKSLILGNRSNEDSSSACSPHLHCSVDDGCHWSLSRYGTCSPHEITPFYLTELERYDIIPNVTNSDLARIWFLHNSRYWVIILKRNINKAILQCIFSLLKSKKLLINFTRVPIIMLRVWHSRYNH